MINRDQAENLRDLVSSKQAVATAQVKSGCSTIAITSGKGGVGKTSVSIFLAKALAARGEKILLLDGDLGLANLHILLGTSTKVTMRDFMQGSASLKDCISPVEPGIDLLAGGSGNMAMANISIKDLTRLRENLTAVSANYDRMIVDGGAGIAESSVQLSLSADQVIVVITPDPTSLADAYATIKILSARGCNSLSVVVNMAEDEAECDAVEEKISLLTDKFLGFTPNFIGRLSRNKKLASMIRQERSLMIAHGLGDFSNRMNQIVQRIIDLDNQ